MNPNHPRVALSLPALLLVLVCSCAALWQGKATQQTLMQKDSSREAPWTIEEEICDRLPKGFRSLGAGLCLEQAEFYLHQGPQRSPAILAWLRAALWFEPQQIDLWETLGRENLFHFGKVPEGIRQLQEGILRNRGHVRQHELWASAGIGCWFYAPHAAASHAVRLAGLKYLSRAVMEARKAGLSGLAREGMHPKAYAVFQARLLAEAGEFDRAWECWQQAGAEATPDSELGRLFSDWHQGTPVEELQQRVLRLRLEEAEGVPQTPGAFSLTDGSPGRVSSDHTGHPGHEACEQASRQAAVEPVRLIPPASGSGTFSESLFGTRSGSRFWKGLVMLVAALALSRLSHRGEP